MINLSSTKAIELVTSASQAIHYDITWIEDDPTADTVAEASAEGSVGTATTTTVVAAPASGKTRRIAQASFMNAGAAINSITVQKDVSGTNIMLAEADLMPGEALRYTSNRGWVVFDPQGREKTAAVGSQTYAANAITTVVLGADVVNNNAVANTIADVTGLSFAVNAGETYWFRFFVIYTAAASTTGSRWTISGPGSPTLLIYRSEYATSSTATTTNEGLSTYDVPAAANGASAAVGANTGVVEGVIKPSASGTLQLRFASEVASSAITAKAGSMLMWQRLA